MERGLFINLLLAVLLICSQPVFAIDVIVNPNVEVSAIPPAQLRLIFSGKRRTWPDGTPVRVVFFDERSPVHARFCKSIIQIHPRHIRRAWDQLLFTGSVKHRLTVSSDKEMIESVLTIPGAIGYVTELSSKEAVNAISLH